MNKPEYKNPPLAEAIIDFIVEDAAEDNGALVKLLSEFGTKFGLDNKTPSQHVTATFIAENESDTPKLTQEQEILGYRFSNKTGTQVIVAKYNGLTMSFLKPYGGWEHTLAQVKDAYMQYIEITGHKKLNRIGMRYINRIELPTGFDDFNEYLETYPMLGSTIPQGLSGMFMRTVIPRENSLDTGILTLGIDDSQVSPQTLPIILDIDVFRVTALKPTAFSDIWAILESLKGYRTLLFEGSITDRTRELFD